MQVPRQQQDQVKVCYCTQSRPSAGSQSGLPWVGDLRQAGRWLSAGTVDDDAGLRQHADAFSAERQPMLMWRMPPVFIADVVHVTCLHC
ncbi:hypothetical protein CBR_g8130 [Chara braunii]|uniref:Uncharacterized protein n=1 Tax=Chara braunii TaxID=69332 RepID=A0A388KLA5_CHABU|nr:hypothetical protein CBR_g8130 [Chara braunii]|eukprot:GBG70830.1 hypothetical protein CBR_g8130 [Chara braunii]